MGNNWNLFRNWCIDWGNSIITGKAIEINGIDLAAHDKEAKTYKECGTLLYNFLKDNFQGELFVVVGQNVRLDMIHICDKLMSDSSWFNFVSYRTLDTGTIGGFAIQLGLLPPDFKAGLGNMAEYFNVGEQEEKHTAKGDVLLNIKVYKALKNLFYRNLIKNE